MLVMSLMPAISSNIAIIEKKKGKELRYSTIKLRDMQVFSK